MKTALRLATKGVRQAGDNPANILSTRSHIALQLAREGHPWLLGTGLLGLRRAYRLREVKGMGDSSVGEALTDYGFALLVMGNKAGWSSRSALQWMRDGIELMETDLSAGRVGFVIRGREKLADSLERAGEFDEAHSQRLAASILRSKHGLQTSK